MYKFFYIFPFLATICWISCKTSDSHTYHRFNGEIFGTTYHITADKYNGTQSQIDSLLSSLDLILSTYKPQSFISKINTSQAKDTLGDWPLAFAENLKVSVDIYRSSDGIFDVSIMPLVNYWGFGYSPKRAVTKTDSLKVDSLMHLVGLNKWDIHLDEKFLVKQDTRQQLDFSALAKGYAVDKVSDWLYTHGSLNHLVEIGGETVVKGVNADQKKWTIGINYPSADAGPQEFIEAIHITDKAMASSGNYRNFYEVKGQKYGHTINPKNGYPYQDELLGITIIADNCMRADALATACMAMGHEKAMNYITTIKDVDALLLIGTTDGNIKEKMTDGFIQYTTRQ